MYRLITSLLSPGGARGRLSAFIFHRVLAQPDPLLPSEPHAELFDRMLGWIGSQFQVLPPLEACERLYARSLPARAAIITFDDGYRDNHDVALPLLQKHRMGAAFFIATGYLNGGTMFNDRVIEAVRGARGAELDAAWLGLGRLALEDVEQRRLAIDRLLKAVKHLPPPERLVQVQRIEEACEAQAESGLMMTDAQVLACHRAGITLGGHTRNHPILRALPDAQARKEIEAGRDDLRAISGEAPVVFAYPNGKLGGDFDSRHRTMVEEAGFRFAFTTHAGASGAGEDRFLLRRYTPWARAGWRFGLQAADSLRREAA